MINIKLVYYRSIGLCKDSGQSMFSTLLTGFQGMYREKNKDVLCGIKMHCGFYHLRQSQGEVVTYNESISKEKLGRKTF